MDYLSGFNSPSINQEQFQQTLIPLPPLAEQEVIVEKVESLLANVSQLREQAEAVEANKTVVGQSVGGWLASASQGGEVAQRFRTIAPQFSDIFSTPTNLKALRQTILQLAIQGQLTAGWRYEHPEAEPAATLLERIQAEKVRLVKEKKIKKPKPLPPITENEVPFALPNGWMWCRLGNISSVVRGGSPRPAGDQRFYNGMIPFLKVADLTKDDNIYVYNYSYTIKEAGLRKTRFVESDTLMLTNSGATLGIPKICTFPTTFNDGVAAFLEAI